MNAKQTLQAFRDLFPGSKVLGPNDDAQFTEKAYRQPLYCNYHGRLRPVGEDVCQYHLETFDPWCWERCETEWTIKRLRPALSASYKHHKDSTFQKAELYFPASGNLWEDR